ncbi:MAG TPA: peroxiredoxin [Polyangiaceae bacterium]|nr:peroxiredoxin [Polyangiaceae bacterium]
MALSAADKNLGRRSLLAIFLVSSAACGPIVRPDGGRGLLPIGALAPDIVGEAPDGSLIRLTATRGHSAIVYFYPKDGTPGCTKEACAFRDAFTRYQRLNVTIFGVSQDSREIHAEFRERHQLPFPLVADEGGAVARAYGVSSPLGMASRVTFLVGADGRIARVWPDVDPGVHANEVLAAVQTTNSAQPSN